MEQENEQQQQLSFDDLKQTGTRLYLRHIPFNRLLPCIVGGFRDGRVWVRERNWEERIFHISEPYKGAPLQVERQLNREMFANASQIFEVVLEKPADDDPAFVQPIKPPRGRFRSWRDSAQRFEYRRVCVLFKVGDLLSGRGRAGPARLVSRR